MGYSKQDFKEGMVLTHTHLINMEDGIIAAAQGGAEDLYASSYGVVPGDVDSAKMTALLTEASTNNKTIRFNDGEYIFSSTIKVPSNVSLVGNTKTVFKPASTSLTTLMSMDSSDNVFLSHLILDGGLTARPTTEGTQVGLSMSKVRRVNIENVEFKGWSKQGFFSGTTSSFGNVADGKFFLQLQVTNCRFYFNYCGMYLDYRAEYNQFLNCVWGENYIGTINCGGNNAYVSCQWNANTTGFKMENSGSNPAHGGCNGCTFNHNYSNAIQVDDCVNGWTFEGCQVFYGSIVLNNCKGVVFNGNIWGSCKFKSTYAGQINQNLIANSYFLTNSATILAGNDGSTFINCCLPDYLPEGSVEEPENILDDASLAEIIYTVAGKNGGASNCYFANKAFPVQSNQLMNTLYIAINEGVYSTIVPGVNVWVVNGETDTVIEKIVDNKDLGVYYSNKLKKFVLKIDLNKTYTHSTYFVVQATRNSTTGIAYGSSGSNFMETTAPEIGTVLSATSGYVAELMVL